MSRKEKLNLGNWGGRREGAGRRKGVAKAPAPTTQSTTTGKPILKSAGEDKPEDKLGFKDLQKKPGVTILDKAVHIPSQVRMVQRGEEWLPEAGPRMRAAKVTFRPWSQTDPDSAAYDAMHKFYREYRRDALVRACINALAYYSTSKGFETQLEPTKKMEPEQAKAFVEQPQFMKVKDEIDRLNADVNLDKVLFTSVVNAKIYGLAGSEKVIEKGKRKLTDVIFLLPLDSQSLTPNLDNDWNKTGYKYNREDNFYEPDEVLYFANLSLTADMVGLSDIEPIMDALLARRAIMEQALPEASTVLWAGVAMITVDTAGLADDDAERVLDNMEAEYKPGKTMFMNQKTQATVVDINPDINKLILTLEYLDQEIIGNFKVPRFLIGRERQVNRATAYAELEAFINGPISQIQRWLARELEAQWYEPLVREILGTGENEEPPIRIKHNWNKISTADFTELMNSITQAYGGGMGWIDIKKAFDLAGFDPNELPKWALPKPALKPPAETVPQEESIVEPLEDLVKKTEPEETVERKK